MYSPHAIYLWMKNDMQYYIVSYNYYVLTIHLSKKNVLTIQKSKTK